MNRQQLTRALRQPHALDAGNLRLLEQEMEEYPYFQAARMLWVKNLHLLGHIRFNNELRLAACHLSDRAKLHDLLNPVSFTDSIEFINIKELNISGAGGLGRGVQSQDRQADHLAGADSLPWNAAGEGDTHEDTIVPGGNRFNDLPGRKPSPGERDFSAMLQHELMTPPLMEYSKLNEEGQDKSRPFTDWLNMVHNQQLQGGTILTAKGGAQKRGNMHLVDSFLEKGPAPKSRLEQPGDNAGGNEDISAKSLQESDDLMSETLANIYIKQKHISKAIDIFERLRLIYPEKNVYFAKRISELEQQDNNK